MRRLPAIAAATLILAGCSGPSAEEQAASQTPKPKAPDATAEQNAKAIENNASIPPAVKKVLTGSAHGQ